MVSFIEWVIFDKIHYINGAQPGVVLEEVRCCLPGARVRGEDVPTIIHSSDDVLLGTPLHMMGSGCHALRHDADPGLHVGLRT